MGKRTQKRGRGGSPKKGESTATKTAPGKGSNRPATGLPAPRSIPVSSGGWERLRSDSSGPPGGPLFDVTREDCMIAFKGPKTGTVLVFKIATQPAGARFAPGRRVVSIQRPDNPEYGDGFGWATDYGVELWGRFPARDGAGKLTRWGWYKEILERPSDFIALGARYEKRPLDTE